ncbi:MAG: RibD family protein [Deltaproteobacteria bacterium]|nr:RibD family protein [Deltaproteobacteria bacterium]MDL1962117.1 RibD family protein [Deltaproteobacteria bacterium]
MKVFLICITTACGRIGPGNLGSLKDRRHLEDMRMSTDASILGAGTLREGDPEMRGVGGIIPENRIRAIITMSGKIPIEGQRLFQLGPPPVVFTSRDQAPSLGEALGHKARVVSLPEGTHGLSISAAISEMGRMGARTVLIEGGAMLNYSALSEGVVDEIYLTIAPKLSGDEGAASLADGPGHLGVPLLPLDLLEYHVEDTGEVFLRYRVKYLGKCINRN